MLLSRIHYATIGLIAIQFLLWFQISTIYPKLGILDGVSSRLEAKVYSINDDQLYFRATSLMIQNAGDSFGRFTAFKDYNYQTLMDWFVFLDTFDDKSNLLPAIASYYYSNTQTPKDNIFIIEYLERRYEKKPSSNWWWLAQATHIALNKMKDRDLALRLALKNAKNTSDKLPIWIKQMPAFILEQKGEMAQAKAIIEDLLQNYDNYTEHEKNFMEHFIKERLNLAKNGDK